MTEDQLFLAALDQPNASARNAYLDEACGNDAALRGKVESLLAAHFQSGEFLDIPAPEQVCIDTSPSCAVTIQSGNMSNHDNDEEIDDSQSLKFLAPSSRPDSLGRIGHYEVLQVLGKGGFGIVLRAFDDVLQRIVAIKVMAPQLAATSPARKRFLREARSSAQVRHENVVQVYEVGEHPLPFLVMEFIPGETLQQRIDRVGPLEVKEALQIGRQIAEGLAAAHAQDLIHRDIKPGNVLLEGAQHKVKITDFGLARAADDASMTQSGMIAGTPMYMAPEQALGQTLDQRADLFSLGSVLYQMVAGRPPFRASTTIAVLKRVADDTPRPIREVIPETPKWLCDIIAKLHAKKPDERYQSAREVADLLADCEAQLKQSSRLQDFSRIPREKSAPRRTVRGTWAAAAGVLLLLLAAFWFGPSALLYLSNRGSLKLLPEEGLISVIVLENNEGDLVTDKLHTPMTDWLDLTEKSHTLRLPPGRYQLNVSTWPAGTRVSQWAISNTGLFGSDRVTVPVINTSAIVTVERGHRVTLRAVISKPAADPTLVSVAPETEGEWVQLFNGKDLTGWSTFDKQWTVRDGILVGQGTKGYVHTLREDFRDFHLRAEVKVAEGSNSGIYFRSSFVDKVRHGYEAEVSLTKEALQTGSLTKYPSKNWLLQQQRRQLLQHDRWCQVEIIAVGKHLVVKVDGNTTAELDDVDFERGHFGLQLSQDATSHVEFRKIEIKELPASPPPSDGFVQLFNGQDLTGWKTDPEFPGHWDVKDGILVGSQRRGVLLSERGDFANFHLRVQAKVNLGGDSGVFFRVESDERQGVGYEAEIHKNRTYARKTGTIEAFQPNGSPLILGLVADDSLTKPDEWFEMEIIAQEGHFITKINGQETANCSLPDNPLASGHIGLQVWNPNTVVQFRKIEIKELPATPLPPDGFVSLFNGKDLTGWKKHSLSGGDWSVVDGAIDGRGTTSYLFSESGDYDNFHLRVEAKVNGNGDAGVCFRTPYDVKGLREGGPAKFGLLEGYEAAIAARPNYANNSGSLTAADGATLQAGPPLPHKPDEWFVLEVIADGNRIRTLVDGKPIVDYVDEERRASRGHLALQVWGPNITSVQFRKIEIRELPLSPSPEGKTPPVAVAPFTDADVQRIAALPAEQQVAAVVASLKQRNPGLNGTASHKIVNGVVTEFNFNPTDDQNAVTDLSPVRALAGLTSLNFWNCSALADLGPLQGLPLTKLIIGSLNGSLQVRDLEPLRGMKLTELHLYRCQVQNLEPLQDMPLTKLTLFSRHVRDCGPLTGLPLTTLGLAYCSQIEDFTPLADLPLTGLHLNDCQVRDLAPFKGMQLTELLLAGTPIRDLELLKGMPLKKLSIHRTGVTDLKPLQGMELDEIYLTPKSIEQGLNILREMKSLKTIGIEYNQAWPAAEFWERYDKGEFAVAPFTDADVQRIAALPAPEQVEEVRAALMRLNPGFGGKMTPTIENGVVMEFSVNTDEILNVAPVRALTKLVYLDLRGTYPNKGKLSDISPLAAMTISRLDCSSTQISDLSQLADLPLTVLHVNHNPVSDLSPLKKMPLENLGIAETQVSDLSPLKGMKIKVLGAQLLPVTDLSPLAGMPLTGLDLYHTVGVTSLEPLRGMPLEGLNLQDVPVSDLSPLAGMTTLRTLNLAANKVSDLSPLAGLKLTDLLMHGEQITDLSPLKGLPLTRLTIDGTGVSNLQPLAGMPLVEFRLNPKNITEGMDVVRGLKTIQTIGTPGNQTWKPEEFWQRYDKGEFKE